MSLSDIVAALDMAAFPIIGLVAFVAVFAAVSWRAFRTSKTALEHYANLPLESGEDEKEHAPASLGGQP